MIEFMLTWALAMAAEPPAPEVRLHHPFSERIIGGLGAEPVECRRRLAARFGEGATVDCAFSELKVDQFMEGWRRSFPDGVASETVRPLCEWMEIFGGWWRRYYDVDGTPVVVAYGGRSKGLYIAYHERQDHCADRIDLSLPPAGRDGVSNPERIDGPWTAPAYPLDGRRRRMDGMVLMRAIVDGEGKVGGVCVLDAMPLGYGFEKAAAEAIRGVEYHPAEKDGRPVAASVLFARTFIID